MRRILDTISVVLLFVMVGATGLAIYGPNPLPDHIPSHFNNIGQPDAWTTPSAYQILPVIAVVVYLALTVAAVYSSLARQEAQQNPNSTPLFGALTLKLIAGIKAELTGVFTCMQLSSLHIARNSDAQWSIWSIGTWLLTAAIVATVAWFVRKMIHVEQGQQALSENS
jgi:uncharacterized membrane protein